MNPTIAIDSREQRPYAFEGPTERVTLPVGDYSISGLEAYVSVERKQVDDLVNCLCHDRDRFERELYRMKALDYGAVVVEASLSNLANGKYRSGMNPKSAIQSLLACSVRYKLPIFFCENRQYGQRVTESLLQKYAREIEKRYRTLENGKA